MDEKLLGRIRRKLTLDVDFMNDCAAFDDMDNMHWDMPAGLSVHEWVRKRVSTDAHDILKTAVNLFDTQHPKWQILPRGPADAEKAEQLERWLEWQMLIANQNGDDEPSREALRHAAKYGGIAAQIDCRPYWVNKDSEEYKEALANPFCITIHPRANIHYERGKYGLRWVANVSNVPAADVIDHWDAYQTDKEYGKKIESAIEKIEKFLEDDEEARLMYVDYTDKDKRWVFAYLTNSTTVDTDLEPPKDDKGEKGELIEIVEGENKLGFINWAISKAASTPLLHSLHKGGLFENQCFLDTALDSVGIRRLFAPLIKHKSNSGKAMEVDFSGNEATVELSANDGEEADYMNLPPLDPAVRELVDRNSQKAASATGLKGMQNMNLVGNVQYASVNAMIQVSKSTLDPYLSCYQHNAAELGRLMFLWVKKANITLTGYRTKDKNKELNKVKGEKINVGPNDFDPTTMIIQCELLSINPSDEMQRMNVFSQAVQIGLPLSKKDIAERMGWGEGEVLEQDWIQEKIKEMALAYFQKSLDLQLQMEAEKQKLVLQMQAQQMQQQQAMEQQAQMQPPEGPQGMPPPEQMGGANMMPGGQANNPAQGGLPPAMSSPGETRTVTQRPGP